MEALVTMIEGWHHNDDCARLLDCERDTPIEKDTHVLWSLVERTARRVT